MLLDELDEGLDLPRLKPHTEMPMTLSGVP